MTERGVAVITGGSSGLGLSMARRLARDGYALALLARQTGPLETAAAETQAHGAETFVLPCEVTCHDQMIHAAQETRTRFGRVDFLIVNAGVIYPGLVEDIDRIDDLKAHIEINLWGAVLTVRTFAPLLTHGGRILFVSSGFRKGRPPCRLCA